jgi:hypothetical protein
MHDKRGRELKVGDRILIPYVIESTSPGEGYCNVSARSVFGRKPDGLKECFSGNAAVVLRANDGDDNAAPFEETA